MQLYPNSSQTHKSLEYLFNNENIKLLKGLKQTEEVQDKMIDLSVQ